MRAIKIDDDCTVFAEMIAGVKVVSTADEWNWFVQILLPMGGVETIKTFRGTGESDAQERSKRNAYAFKDDLVKRLSPS